MRLLLHLCASAAVATTSAAGILVGSDVSSDSLYEVDRQTAFTSLITPFSHEEITGLAYDAGRHVLYGVDPLHDQVHRIDVHTGQLTPIADISRWQNANGLAFDPLDDVLFVSDNSQDRLLEVDPATGSVTVIGTFPLFHGGVEGLAFDEARDTLFGLSRPHNEIVIIDQESAGVISILTLPDKNWSGLEFDPVEQCLYASVSVSGSLYRVDHLYTQPLLTEIGKIHPAQGIQGLAIIPDAPVLATLLLAAAGGAARRSRRVSWPGFVRQRSPRLTSS